MQVKVNWKGDVAFSGETESGHAIAIDGPPDLGGKNLGARPMELILVALASCSAIDVVNILKKARQPIECCDVAVRAERAEKPPKVFTCIHLHFSIKGNQVGEQHVARAIKLSADKYCSASIMLRPTVSITHDFEIN